MLNRFDWLRRSQTGTDLLATLRYFEASPELPSSAESEPAEGGELGPPFSALNTPCRRCGVYPRTRADRLYCSTCQAILGEARKLGTIARYALVVWGFVNQMPRQLHQRSSGGDGFRDGRILGAYVHDANHFLVMLYHLSLKPWFQDLAIYHGDELKGLLQVFPTTGATEPNMGDLLTRVVHQEARFPLDRLRVRFYSSIHQVFNPRLYERAGVLTFEVSDFLNTMEMAAVFRSILHPDEQKALRQLLMMENTGEAQFYWGRFLGTLSQQARDMLEAWRIRQWSEPQINLLYELSENVAFYQSD